MKFKCQKEECSRYAIMNTAYCKWHLINQVLQQAFHLPGKMIVITHIIALYLGYRGIECLYWSINCIIWFLQTKDILYLLFLIFHYFVIFLLFLSIIIIIEKFKWSNDIFWPMCLTVGILLHAIAAIFLIFVKIYVDPSSLEYIYIDTLPRFNDFNIFIIENSIRSLGSLLIFVDLLRNEPIILRLMEKWFKWTGMNL